MMNSLKGVIGIIMVAAMTIAVAGCGAAQSANAAEQEEQMIGMPNPFVDVDSLEAAAEIAGFKMTAPNSLEGYNSTTIQAIEDNLIQVIYGDLDHNIYFRKAVGTEDISGDFNEYEGIKSMTSNGKDLTIKSSGDKTHVILWNDGEFSYSIQSNEGFNFADVQMLLEK